MVEKTKFFEIELPLIGEKVELIGKTQDDLIGRTVKIDLTRKLKGKGAEIIFDIKKINEQITSKTKRIHVLGYFIRRMMRKSISYVEDSFDATCKDGVLKIKPFLITRKKVVRAVRTALQAKAKEEIINEVKEKTADEIFAEILFGKLQKNLSLKLKKIYPLALCEVRDIFLVK